MSEPICLQGKHVKWRHAPDSPIMFCTVHEPGKHHVMCAWFGRDGAFFQNHFSVSDLALFHPALKKGIVDG